MRDNLVRMYQLRFGTRLGGLLCVVTAALLLVLAGCGGGETNSGKTAVSVTTPAGLTATLSQDRSRVSGLRDITYTVRLQNDTNASITFQADIGPHPDEPAPTARLEIIDDTGVSVYPSDILPERPIRKSVDVTLAPGQSLSESYPFSSIETLPNPLFPRAGNYRATARFTILETQTAVGPLIINVR